MMCVYKKRGFIALTSVLVLGAILLAVSIGIASRSIAGTGHGSALYSREKAASFAELCAVHALMELERVLGYSGDEEIAIANESCAILSIEGTGNTERTIRTESAVGGYTERLVIEAARISPEMEISSWKSVSDF